MRRKELDLKAAARMARGSTGTAVRRGVMAACARPGHPRRWPRAWERWTCGRQPPIWRCPQDAE
eukprot:3914882-Pleurochrysis_carterae.AAC.1